MSSLLSDAEKYLRSGRLQEAEQICRPMLKESPVHPQVLAILASVAMMRSKWMPAIELLEQLVPITQTAEDYSSLGLCYKNLSKTTKAIEALQRSVQIKPLVNSYILLAKCYEVQKDTSMAIQTYKDALKLNQRTHILYTYIAKNLGIKGDMDQSKEYYEKAMEANSEFSYSFFHYSRIVKYASADDPVMQRMLENLEAPGLEAEDKMFFHYALGKAYEDVQDFEQSIGHYIKANDLRRKNINFDIENDKRFIKETKAIFDSAFFEKRDDFGVKNAAPVFILGMPRSGSTLIEQILSSHSDVKAGGELVNIHMSLVNADMQFAQQDFLHKIAEINKQASVALGSRYVAYLRKFIDQSAPLLTNKDPINYLFIGLIKILLPNAKVINCVRDPVDICLSCFKVPFAGEFPYSYNLKELGNYYLLYQELMTHWHKTLPGFVYDFSYEDLVAEPEQEIKGLLDYCGLEWQDSCLSFHENKRAVQTASVVQVRQPLYKGSVGKWKKFAPYIKDLTDILGVE